MAQSVCGMEDKMAEIEFDDVEEIIVNLELEGSGEVECEIICIFEFEGKNYAALTPTDESVEELYFFGLEMTDSDEDSEEVELTLENIDDDDLLEKLSVAFQELVDEAAEGEEEDSEEDAEESAAEAEDDDSKWDEFINKKL